MEFIDEIMDFLKRLNFVNTRVVKFTSKVIMKLSGFFTTGKGGRMS